MSAYTFEQFRKDGYTLLGRHLDSEAAFKHWKGEIDV